MKSMSIVLGEIGKGYLSEVVSDTVILYNEHTNIENRISNLHIL